MFAYEGSGSRTEQEAKTQAASAEPQAWEPGAGDPRPSLARVTGEREALEDELRALAGDLNAAHARFVELLGEHIANEYFGAHPGAATPVQWVSWQLGVTPGAARGLVEVATGLAELPGVRAAFATGALSLYQVRILVDIAEPATEAELLRLATGLSAAQLARFATHYRKGLADPDAGLASRYARSHYGADGSYRLSARLPAAEGALVDAALDAAVAAMRAEGIELDRDADDPWGAGRADALVDVARAALATSEVKASRSEYEVIVHADMSELARDEGGISIEDGGPLAPATLARIACDCAATAITSDGDGNLNAGRRTRTISRAMRRALHKRDTSCCFPGCSRTAYTQAHHIRYWTQDGPTDLDNLMRLCWLHHRAVHEGGVTIHQLVDGTYEFRRSDGCVIEATPSSSGSAAGLRSGNQTAGINTNERTCTPEWNGEPADLRLAADLMLMARGSPGGSDP